MHCRARGRAVVDEDHDLAQEIRQRSIVTVDMLAPSELTTLALDYWRKRLLVETELT
jgi:hypothetical protein